MPRITAALMALAVAGVSAASPAAAQDEIVVTDPALLAEVAQSEARGRMLWLYDQAAWHATDALLEDLDPTSVANPRGYVVVPGEDDGTLQTLFVAEDEGKLKAFARYTIRGSEVIGGGRSSGRCRRSTRWRSGCSARASRLSPPWAPKAMACAVASRPTR